MELFTTGYQLWRTAEFDAEVRKRGAMVLDIRFAPWSKDPDWRSDAIAGRLANRYRSVPALGNVNYKGDGPVRINDLESGVAVVREALQRGPVILLCACWNPESCHRTQVAARLRERGLDVRELEVPPKERGTPGQLDLFE